jgi:hypothetical protein
MAKKSIMYTGVLFEDSLDNYLSRESAKHIKNISSLELRSISTNGVDRSGILRAYL